MPIHRRLCEPMNCVHFHISDPVPSELLTKEELNVFMTLFHKIQYALEKEEREEGGEVFKKPVNQASTKPVKRKYRSSTHDDSSCEDDINYVKPKKKLYERDFRPRKNSDDRSSSVTANFFESGMILDNYSREDNCKDEESSSTATFFENGMLLDENQRKSVEKADSKDSSDLFYFIEFSNWSLMELPGSPAILVDGYINGNKGMLEKSYPVVKRHSNNFIECSDGSFFRLNGEMNAEEAIKSGFSKDLVDAFLHGFPPNWKKFIKDHFRRKKAKHKEYQQSLPYEVKRSQRRPSYCRNDLT
ncbi:DgyrCDS4723 [Dimorphilus gyrociliatus]|uniref:DgyrCDS4723 n=1 Tax=Dimorphilus gyrociliatus TaxID=2664684 RepID=A0A7I8VHF9_9ANNE|nr:DgyrCDS4723 [Dimorphilus gyrociliatus]